MPDEPLGQEAPDEPPEYDRQPSEDWDMKVFAKRTRAYARDQAEKNHLNLGDLEHDWSDIYDAVEAALADWDATPPITNHKIKEGGEIVGLDHRAYHLIIRKATAELFMSASGEQA